LLVSGTGSCGSFRGDGKNAEDFAGKVMQGYPRHRQSLPGVLSSSEFNRFGLTVDADNDASIRWQSLTGRLWELESRLAFRLDAVPEGPNASGTALRTDSPLTVGLWLWPDNPSEGNMESFAGALLPAEAWLTKLKEVQI
jgi:hypothetical protein